MGGGRVRSMLSVRGGAAGRGGSWMVGRGRAEGGGALARTESWVLSTVWLSSFLPDK